MRDRPVVGQKLILCSRDLRRDPNSYRRVTVTEVGRKYFKVDFAQYSNLRFCLEDWIEDGRGYSANYKLYLNQEEIQSEIAANLALKTLRQYFSQYGQVPASADELLECCGILGLYEGVTAELDEKLENLYQQLGEHKND